MPDTKLASRMQIFRLRWKAPVRRRFSNLRSYNPKTQNPKPKLVSSCNRSGAVQHVCLQNAHGDGSRSALYQSQSGAEDHHPGANPDPDDHWVQVRLDHGLSFIVLSLVDQI